MFKMLIFLPQNSIVSEITVELPKLGWDSVTLQDASAE